LDEEGVAVTPSLPLLAERGTSVAGAQYVTVRVWRHRYRSKYDTTQDSFLHWKFAVAPCVALAVATMVFSQNLDLVDFLWSFSIYLEALAIVPQLFVLQRYREVENLTGHYIFFLGAYRFLYILNWIYRSYYEPYYHHNWVCALACARRVAALRV
jgi:ER lumen protein retaining receptor